MAMRFFEQQAEARRRTLRLVVLFAIAVAGTVVGVHLALCALWWPLHVVGTPYPRLFTTVNVGVTLVLVIGGWWIETSNLQMPDGVQRLARRLGARELQVDGEEAEKRLANVVDEICIAANMPHHPQVMVLPRNRAINAFAAGWESHDAVVAVTQGALEVLTREELQGLVAHECSHIHEGDTRLNMQLAGMVSGLELVWRFGQAIRERGDFGAIVGAPVQWAGSIGWYAARWLQASVARERELLADARAVQWTRSRDGLGGVLRKALAQWENGDDEDRGDDPAWPLIAHHLLLVGHEDRRARWFDAHPPLALRIERIYGRPMASLPLDDGAAPTIPATLA